MTQHSLPIFIVELEIIDELERLAKRYEFMAEHRRDFVHSSSSYGANVLEHNVPSFKGYVGYYEPRIAKVVSAMETLSEHIRIDYPEDLNKLEALVEEYQQLYSIPTPPIWLVHQITFRVHSALDANRKKNPDSVSKMISMRNKLFTKGVTADVSLSEFLKNAKRGVNYVSSNLYSRSSRSNHWKQELTVLMNELEVYSVLYD